jgi:hypothetical protein
MIGIAAKHSGRAALVTGPVQGRWASRGALPGPLCDSLPAISIERLAENPDTTLATEIFERTMGYFTRRKTCGPFTLSFYHAA